MSRITKKQKEIVWHLLRRPSNEVTKALAGIEGDHRSYCLDRGFTFEEASKAISALFDTIKPTE